MYTADLHTHTIASTHAYSTINEYAAQAKVRGIRLLATTDHGPALDDAPMIWHFMNLRVIPRILDGVIVLRGVEANILDKRMYPEHPLDCPDDVLTSLDIVLAGLHSPCQIPLSRKENTRLLIETICSGRAQIITHPGNPLFPIEAKAVAEVATAHHVALEVNNSSFLYTRKGSTPSCIELLTALRDAGGFAAAGSDAHHSHSLGHFEESLKIVEAVGFPEDRIINRTPEAVLHFLETYHGQSFPELAGVV